MTIEEHIKSYRVRHSLKVALAGSLCVILSAFLHIPAPYFAVMTVHIMMTVHRDNTFEQGIERWLGRSLGAVIGLISVYIFHNMLPLYLFTIFFWLCLSTYLYVEQKFSYASLMVSVATAGVMYTGLVSIGAAEALTVDWIIQIALGVLVVWLIDYLLWPPKTLTSIKESMSRVAGGFRDTVHALISKAKEGESPVPVRTRLTLDTINSISSLVTRAEKEEREGLFPGDLYIKLIAHSKSLFVKLESIDVMLHKDAPFLSEGELSSGIYGVLEAAESTFSDLEDSILRKSSYEYGGGEIHERLHALEEKYIAMRKEAAFSDWEYEEVLELGSFISLLKNAAEDLDEISAAWGAIQSHIASSESSRPLSAPPKVGSYIAQRELKLNIESLKKGIKTGLAVMVIVFGYLYLSLPSGVGLSAIITILVISYQANLGMSHLKARLRFIGCLIGGLYGLTGLYILSQSPHMPILVMVLFLGLFLATYVALGSERVSYAGVQAGLVLPLSLLITNGPPVSLNLALDRFLGIILGCLVVLFILHFVWPQDPIKLLKQKLSAAISDSGLILNLILGRRAGDMEELGREIDSLESKLPSSSALLKDAGYILFGDYKHAGQYLTIIESLEKIYVESESLKRVIYEGPDQSLIDKYMEYMGGHYEKMTDCFADAASRLVSTGKIAGSQDTAAVVEEIRNARDEFRSRRATFAYGSEELERFSLVLTGIDGILGSIATISHAVKEIDESDRSANDYKFAGAR